VRIALENPTWGYSRIVGALWVFWSLKPFVGNLPC